MFKGSTEKKVLADKNKGPRRDRREQEKNGVLET